jgi:hypothetical protein
MEVQTIVNTIEEICKKQPWLLYSISKKLDAQQLLLIWYSNGLVILIQIANPRQKILTHIGSNRWVWFVTTNRKDLSWKYVSNYKWIRRSSLMMDITYCPLKLLKLKYKIFQCLKGLSSFLPVKDFITNGK